MLIFVVVSLLFVIVYCIHRYLGGNLNITSNNKGVTIVTGRGVLENEKMFAILSLPSSVCWFNTGVILKPNESLKIKASGVIHTSADKLIESAKSDLDPPYDWNDVNGRHFIETNMYRDTYRRNYFIHKSRPQKIGNLLAYLRGNNEDVPSKDNPRPERTNEVVSITDDNDIIKNTSSENRTLFLTVNDIVFENTKDAEIAYAGDLSKAKNKEERDKCILSQNRWKKILEMKSWDIFFKDNLGTFLIQIEKIDE